MDKKWLLLLVFGVSFFRETANRTYRAEYFKGYRGDTLFIPYHPLQSDQDLDLLIKEIGNAKVVLLGESTHGTHEFYDWRTAITKRLVREKGFGFIAIEGDWVDSYRVNQFVKGPLQDSEAVLRVLRHYDRWPASMWGNHEMVPLIRWLNSYNQQAKKKVGFYGVDLYSFWEWTEEQPPVEATVLEPSMQKLKDYFAPYHNDAMKYATAVHQGKRNGSAVTENFWKNVRQFNGNRPPGNESQFVLQEEAALALDGERYFRTLTVDHVQALNLRDEHMAMTIDRLLKFYGPDSKAIIWVHNDHIGDAQYSNEGNSGYVSLGEILRNEWGHNKIFSAGFGTYKGYVTAGYSWNAPVQRQVVLPAKAGSWEALLHDVNKQNKLILSKDLLDNNSFNKRIEFRSIGASYSGAAIYNYSIMPRRFDVFLFIDSTTATHPLEIDSTGVKKQ